MKTKLIAAMGVLIVVVGAGMGTGCGDDTGSVFTGGAGGGTMGSGGTGADGNESGSGSGTGGQDPGSFACDGQVCAEQPAQDAPCVGLWACGDGENNTPKGCYGLEYKPGRDDSNKCTHDTCEGGMWKHTPYTASEMDDGDPCTKDECDIIDGVIHIPICP